MADEILLGLSRDQALVLFDWLARTDEAGEPAGFADQAEQRVFWDMSAALESLLAAPFASDYRAQLERARATVRDSEE
ncbi:hypothetical protein ABZX12_29415 [Kribbella sp. NPDC003505]|uniref:hypothetical protein n=1 Tax=unclassified Kribbella TaxID=2644121 RepID=UPI0033BDB36A